jgi:hypothetical protein
MIDLSALRQAGGWAARAADIFEAALGLAPGRLTPLALGGAAFVDVRVELAHAGPEGATRLLYQNPSEEIVGDVGPIMHGPLSGAAIRQRRLLFQITVNTATANTMGKILQTLRHEYAGHASPWGGYLAPLMNPAVPADRHEDALEEAMDGLLWGGIQHLKMAEGKASHFAVLGEAIKQVLIQANHQQDLVDYLAAEMADLASLRVLTPTPAARALLLVTANLTAAKLVETVIPTPRRVQHS